MGPLLSLQLNGSNVVTAVRSHDIAVVRLISDPCGVKLFPSWLHMFAHLLQADEPMTIAYSTKYMGFWNASDSVLYACITRHVTLICCFDKMTQFLCDSGLVASISFSGYTKVSLESETSHSD